jgi:hypothetical protein
MWPLYLLSTNVYVIGLSVHLNQVHKEQLNSVENALPNRQGLEVEIFGMEGIPDDVMQTHNTRVMQQYYEAAAERRAKSGNLMPGEAPKRKKIKFETEEELKKRFQQWRENGGEIVESNPTPVQAPAPVTNSPVVLVRSTVHNRYLDLLLTTLKTNAPFGQALPLPNNEFPPTTYLHQLPGQSGFPPANPFPSGHLPHGLQAPFPGAPISFGGAAIGGAPAGLPPRPGFPGVPGQFPGAPFSVPGANGNGNATAAAVDDLIASVTGQSAKTEDKKSKKEKDKNMRMVYSDNDTSPEEMLATLSRYAFSAA